MNIKPHPGWRTGGLVYRGANTFQLLDCGRFVGTEWQFTAKELSESNDYVHHIIPQMGDHYISPARKNQKMISRHWIVVASFKGPSPLFFQHNNKQSAIDEAKKLAVKNPSDTFFVYELCNAFQVESVKEIEVGDIPF